MAKLTVISGPDQGNEFELARGDGDAAANRLRVGRDPSVEIPLTDPAVSREHFCLEPSARGFRLVDLGSRNRTFLNGGPVREDHLNGGDVIRIGDTELRFEGDREAIDGDSMPSTIIKELPTGEGKKGTFIERIALLEDHLNEDRNREAVKGIEKLLALYGQIANTTSVQDLFQRLLERLGPTLGADRCAVLVAEDDAWTVAARFPRDASGLGGLSSSVVRSVAEGSKAVLSRHTASDDRFSNSASVVTSDIATAMAAPIASPDAEETAAVLYCDRRGDRQPFTESDLELLAAAAEPAAALLASAEKHEALRDANRNLFRSLTEEKRIVGHSAAIQAVFEFVERAAPTPMTVLITGETGTGKELVASAVHYASPRRGHPFVAINCAALPENLVESELFGHERGAFTGAVARRKGKFEQADSGTVFLDEIGELSLACQAKLLRLLEERQFERVGGAESIRVDVRVIAATNRDLLQEVEAGKFREDLYYRLSVLNVGLPPLRDRTDDIPLLAEHFLETCSGGVKKLTPAAEEKLLAYAWPGNVRQLRNIIESATVLGDGNEIRPENLVLPPSSPNTSGGATSAAAGWKPTSLSEIEKDHIQRVLEHTGGNKKRAAEILGIERCTLYSKLKNYGLFSPGSAETAQ